MTIAEPAPLLRLCRDPALAGGLGAEDWHHCLRTARREEVVARLGYRISDAGRLGDCPAPVRDLLMASRCHPRLMQTQVARELHHVRRSLAAIGAGSILLKGAAYLSAGLPGARGRRMKDLDILVRRDRLAEIEERLLADGWEATVSDDYDQYYYRTWMHEIPPLRHPERGLEVDIHHALLPLSGRLRSDPELLWQAAVPLAGHPGVSLLSPPDMVLHTAAHLFQDGEVRGGLNDLWDLDELLRGFAAQPAFWPGLIERAARLDLGRPLHYALATARRLLWTPGPDPVLGAAARRFGPPRSLDALMRTLFDRVLTPASPATAPGEVCAWLLYVRAHWLRMPPSLLVPHLARKTWRRLAETVSRSTPPE